MKLTQEEIQEQILRAFARSLRYLSFRARSEKEMIEYLTKKEFDPLIIQAVIERLKDENIINDRDFAQQWTDSRQNSKGKSKYVIKRELQQKGIKPETIDETLADSSDDLAVAQALWEKKKKKFDGYDKDERFQKAAAFLQRRGYGYEIIKKILNDETDNT